MGDTADKQLSDDRYRIWKKNTPLRYDLVVSNRLQWPSLTCQWLPDGEQFNRDCTKGECFGEKLILGTHTSYGNQNYLMIAEGFVSKVKHGIGASTFHSNCNDSRGGCNTVHDGSIDVIQRINHYDEHNDVFLFHIPQHPPFPTEEGLCTPQLRLTGHQQEGIGLSWNVQDQGKLLSGSDDHLICAWDIQSPTFNGNGCMDPLVIYDGHTDVVEDVAWHRLHRTIFGSVGLDAKLLLWDTREKDRKKPISIVDHQKRAVICISFNPFNEWLFATGSADRTVALWDIRNMACKLNSLESHWNDVLQVEWSPFDDAVLASASADKNVIVWDLDKIGQQQDRKHSPQFPPELLFMHDGHTNKVTDLSWNPNEPWVIVSVADCNAQIWCMADHIYEDECE